MEKKVKYATITEALRYPFKKISRLFYWVWLLIPILGLIIYAGYLIKLVKSVIHETENIPPKFGSIKENIILGFYVLLIFAAYQTLIILLGVINMYFSYFLILIVIVSIYVNLIVAILYVQLAERGKLKQGLNIIRATKIVLKNLDQFLVLLLKQIVLLLIWVLVSIPVITIIFTLPALCYGTAYIYADFYKKANKPR